MGSMSYCLFENTLSDFGRCVDKMMEAETLEDLDLNDYEMQAFLSFWRACREFMAEHERLLSTQRAKEMLGDLEQ